MEFQIEEKLGKGCGSYSYFTVKGDEAIDQLKKLAIDAEIKEFESQNDSPFGWSKPKPTIKVFEYDSVNNCRVKGGIKFKVKWRT